MGNTSTSTLVFDAEAVRAVSEIEKLSAANRDLRKALREAAEQSVRGNKASEETLATLARKYAGNSAAIDGWREAIKRSADEANKKGDVVQRLEGRMVSSSQAAVQFARTLSDPNKGLADALAASAMNAGALIATVNPLAGAAAIAGAELAKMAIETWKAADAKKDYAKSAELAIGKMREEIAAARDLGDERQRELAALHGIGDEKNANSMREIRQAQLDLRNERDQAAREHLVKETLKGRALTKAQREAIVNNGDVYATVDPADRHKGRLGEIDRQLLGLHQQENLINQQREAKEQSERDREAKEFERASSERRTREVQERLAPWRGQLSQAAAERLAAGASPAEVEEELRGSLTIPGDQDIVDREIGEIVRGARSPAAGRLRPKDPPTADERRTQEIQAARAQRQAELAGDMAGQRPGRQRSIQGRHARRFGEVESRERAEEAEIRARAETEALRDLERKSDREVELHEREVDLLAELVDLMRSRPDLTAPRPNGRSVPRN